MNWRAASFLLALSTMALTCAPDRVRAQAPYGASSRNSGQRFGAPNFPRPSAGRTAGGRAAFGAYAYGAGGYGGPAYARSGYAPPRAYPRAPTIYGREPFSGVPYPPSPYRSAPYAPPAYTARPYAPAYPPAGYGPPVYSGNWRQEQNEVRQAVREGRHIPLGQAIEAVRRRSPGRELDADLVQGADGRPAYRLRWAASDGRRIDYLVDAATGAIVGVEGAR